MANGNPKPEGDFFKDIMSSAAVNASTEKLHANQRKRIKQQDGLDNEDINRQEKTRNVTSSVNNALNKLFTAVTPSGSLRGDVGSEAIDNMLLLAQTENKHFLS